MSLRDRTSGSRFLYDPFDAATARIEANERVHDERWAGLEKRLVTIEDLLARLEKRLWLALFGVVAFVLTKGVHSVMTLMPN